MQLEPHEAVSVFERHCVAHTWKPVLHTKPHTPDVQVAVPLGGGVGQGVQLLPHVAGSVSFAQTPLHAWKPALHEMPQVVPSHDAMPFEGVAHALHDAPHVSGSLLLTQVPEQL